MLNISPLKKDNPPLVAMIPVQSSFPPTFRLIQRQHISDTLFYMYACIPESSDEIPSDQPDQQKRALESGLFFCFHSHAFSLMIQGKENAMQKEND